MQIGGRGTQAMGGQLQTSGGATITTELQLNADGSVKTQGTLLFAQDANVTTAGGIHNTDSGNHCLITNFGATVRDPGSGGAMSELVVEAGFYQPPTGLGGHNISSRSSTRGASPSTTRSSARAQGATASWPVRET